MKIEIEIEDVTNHNIKEIVKNFETFLWSECMEGEYIVEDTKMKVKIVG